MATKLSPEAIDYLRSILAEEVYAQTCDGRENEPMPPEWTELYNLTIGF